MSKTEGRTAFALGAAVVLGLYLSSLRSYLLFHSLIEIVTIAISFSLFMLTWNGRCYLSNGYLRALGIGYGCVAFVDLVHTLAYKGMNVFPGYGANLPTQLWIAARYLQATMLLVAPFLVKRRTSDYPIFGISLVATAGLLVWVFSGHFPNCFVDGQGLTRFKITSEYAISGLLLLALIQLLRKRADFDRGVLALIGASLAFSALAEISFTAYVSVYGFANMVGHYAKLAAFYLMYRAILVTGIRQPFAVIFRDLKQTEAALRKSEEGLEDKVKARTAELHASEEHYAVMSWQLEGVNGLQQSLLKPAPLGTKLGDITSGIVQYFEADFCRIWTVGPGDLCEQGCAHADAADGTHACRRRDKCLHLVASAGRYTHLDGKGHRRVPLGAYKIGKIACGEEHKFLVGDVVRDPRVHDRDWARKLGLVSFAGYQLRIPGGEPMGVLALFSKRSILAHEDAILDGLSSAVALSIQQANAEQALQEAHDHLEVCVEQRTAELTCANDGLRHEVAERCKAEEARAKAQAERDAVEVQLHQAQRLESVGQLAAGIAHEINTPAQFVGDSIGFLAEAFDRTLVLVDKYRDQVGSSGNTELVATMAHAEDEADLDYTKENAPDAIRRARDGVSRIATIVAAMKEFAHPETRQKERCDLNRAIETTLTIARNEYKYLADVETALGNLPLVLCHLGDLNQVFLNLIVNAAHAIAAVVGNSGSKGRITVRTACEGASVRIEITDTGCGIPDEIRDRVFDPFFTTKEVGRGSGQGLAIARNIVVDKHGGTLGFTTEPGKGTTFTVILPVEAGR
jgi:signal transduction histidine kinase